MHVSPFLQILEIYWKNRVALLVIVLVCSSVWDEFKKSSTVDSGSGNHPFNPLFPLSSHFSSLFPLFFPSFLNASLSVLFSSSFSFFFTFLSSSSPPYSSCIDPSHFSSSLSLLLCVCEWVYDAVNMLECIASNSMMASCFEGPRKATKNINHDSRRLGLDSNRTHIRLHDVTWQKTVFFQVTAVRTSDLIFFFLPSSSCSFYPSRPLRWGSSRLICPSSIGIPLSPWSSTHISPCRFPV
jgi:hypothetical protein